MARKHTISKVLIQTSATKGFTLIELLVGLSITFLIGGFAMNAFINTSSMYSKDKRDIDSNQNLSAILEIVGIDIQQTGEQITDGNFPVVVFQPITTSNVQIPGATTGTYYMPGSSTITIRRALVPALTLCQAIAVGATPTTLVVADNSSANTSCQSGTLSTNTAVANPPAAATTLTPTLSRPAPLMAARNYRCRLDNINGDYSAANTDFCQSALPSSPSPSPSATPAASVEIVRAAISDQTGNIRTFNYTGDSDITIAATTGTPPVAAIPKFNIAINSLSTSTPADNGYTVGNPIYLIEERTYALTSDARLLLQVDGGTPQILIKGLKKFNISARVYGDTSNKTSDPLDSTVAAPSPPVAPSILPKARRCDATIPYYLCAFKTATYATDSWKTLQGIKIEIQGQYDPTGRSVEHPTDPNLDPADVKKAKEKLTAVAEFFPRNILSK
jgi:Tfp pilus assembly protein PilW